MLKLPLGIKNTIYIKDFDKPETYIPFVVGVLNSCSKGTLYFGVNELGEVIGTAYSRNTITAILKSFEENITPKVVPLITSLKENKNVLKVEFEGYSKPYSYKSKYYLKDYQDIRTMDYVSLMNEIKIIDKDTFIEDETTNTSFRQLDDSLIKKTWQNAIASKKYKPKHTTYSQKSVLENWGLSKKGDVTKAAVLLYGKRSPISLTINIYGDEKCSTLISTNLYKGNIISLISFSKDYVKKTYLEKFKMSSRVYQGDIIEQLIINAFLHANYNISTNFKIIISPYKFTIINPGEFPKGYDVEDFATSRARIIINNKVLAKILNYEGYAHLNGNGFKTLLELTKDNKRYIYRQVDDSFEFSLFMFINKYRYMTLEKAVLTILVEKPFIKADEIGKMLGKTRRTIQSILKTLKEKNLIIRKGSNKTGFWVVNK